MRSALFCDVTQRWLVILYRRFGTTDRISWPLKMVPIGFPETSAQNYYSTLHNNAEKLTSLKRTVLGDWQMFGQRIMFQDMLSSACFVHADVLAVYRRFIMGGKTFCLQGLTPSGIRHCIVGLVVTDDLFLQRSTYAETMWHPDT
jgi:hypothetical protein